MEWSDGCDRVWVTRWTKCWSTGISGLKSYSDSLSVSQSVSQSVSRQSVNQSVDWVTQHDIIHNIILIGKEQNWVKYCHRDETLSRCGQVKKKTKVGRVEWDWLVKLTDWLKVFRSSAPLKNWMTEYNLTFIFWVKFRIMLDFWALVSFRLHVETFRLTNFIDSLTVCTMCRSQIPFGSD